MILAFDVVIDEPAACKFLHTNGHNVTVKSGVDFVVGKPVAPADTATLLTITTTTMFYGELQDSVHRVLKNNYVNGLRRMVAIERAGAAHMEYTMFTYNSQNRLVSLLNYNHDGMNEISRTAISWTNNQVSKVITDVGGPRQSVHSISYVANGANTDVVMSRVDTALTSAGNIAFINSQRTVLTVSSAFDPIIKNIYDYRVTTVGPQESFDTTNSTYEYDALGNLSELREAIHRTNLQPNGSAHRTMDSTKRSYIRNNPDSASVYRFLLDVYGLELLTLIDYGMLPLEIRDVTGHVYPSIAQGEYRRQTASSMIFSARSYDNGHLLNEHGPVQQYKAVNQFDNRHRLINSIIEDGTDYPFIINMRLEYPD